MGASYVPLRYHFAVPIQFFGSVELATTRSTRQGPPQPGDHFQSRLFKLRLDYSKVAETKIPGLNWAVPSSGNRIVTGKVEFPLPGKLIGAILEIVD